MFTVESVVTFHSLCHFSIEQEETRLSKVKKAASRLADPSLTCRHTLRWKQSRAWRPFTLTQLAHCAWSCRPLLEQDLADQSAFGPRQTGSTPNFFQLLSSLATFKCGRLHQTPWSWDFACLSCTILPQFWFIASFTPNYLVQVVLIFPSPSWLNSLLCTCI